MFKHIACCISIISIFFIVLTPVNALNYEDRKKTGEFVSNFIYDLKDKGYSYEKRYKIVSAILVRIETAEKEKADIIAQNERLADILSYTKMMLISQNSVYFEKMQEEKKEKQESEIMKTFFDDVDTTKIEQSEIEENFRYQNGYIIADILDTDYIYGLNFYFSDKDRYNDTATAYYGGGKLNFLPVTFTTTKLDISSPTLPIDYLKTNEYKVEVVKHKKNSTLNKSGNVLRGFIIQYNNPLDKINSNIVMHYSKDNNKVTGFFREDSNVSEYQMIVYRDYYSGEVEIAKNNHFNHIQTRYVTKNNATDALSDIVTGNNIPNKNNNYKVFIKGLDNSGVIKSYGSYYFNAD